MSAPGRRRASGARAGALLNLTNVAYASYYAGGLRVVRFGDDGLQEVGRFIDEGANNLWGVEQFTDAAGNRLIAGSDRDCGLYVDQPDGRHPAQSSGLRKR